MDYKIFIHLFGEYGYIVIILIMLLPSMWRLIKEGWELYYSKMKVDLEILDKINFLFKETLIEDKNLEKLIKVKMKDAIFGLLTGVYNTSEDYKNKILFLYNEFPHYNIKDLIKISPYINIKFENKKIYYNLKFFDKVVYWYFKILNIFLILIGLASMFIAFIKSPKYFILSIISFLMAFFQYKIIEDIDLAIKFCKKHCN